MADADLRIRVSAKDDASSALRSVGGSLQRIGEFAAGGLLGRAAGDVLGLGKSAIVAGFGFNAMKEQAQIAFTTMLGSGQRASRFLNELQAFAAKTPFEFPELVTAAQRMSAMGFTSSQVLPTLTAVGDAVAAMGGNSQNIDYVTRALGQMQAKGKVMAQEMLQLTEQGIPAWKYLAEAIGTDVAGAMKKVEKEGVSAQVAIKAITDGINRDFGGMMDKQSHTFAGMLSNLKDMFGQAQARVIVPFFELAKGKMEEMLGAMGSSKWESNLDALELKFYDIAIAIDEALTKAGQLASIGSKIAGTLVGHGYLDDARNAIRDASGLTKENTDFGFDRTGKSLTELSPLEYAQQQARAKSQYSAAISQGRLSPEDLDAYVHAEDAKAMNENMARAAEDAAQVSTSFESTAKAADSLTDSLRSAASQLFGQPTREQASAQLRLDQLSLSLMNSGLSPGMKSQLEAEQTRTRQRLDSLQLQDRVQQDRLVLADKTLLTEKEQYKIYLDLLKTTKDATSGLSGFAEMVKKVTDALGKSESGLSIASAG